MIEACEDEYNYLPQAFWARCRGQRLPVPQPPIGEGLCQPDPPCLTSTLLIYNMVSIVVVMTIILMMIFMKTTPWLIYCLTVSSVFWPDVCYIETSAASNTFVLAGIHWHLYYTKYAMYVTTKAGRLFVETSLIEVTPTDACSTHHTDQTYRWQAKNKTTHGLASSTLPLTNCSRARIKGVRAPTTARQQKHPHTKIFFRNFLIFFFFFFFFFFSIFSKSSKNFFFFFCLCERLP